jgi:hypothetical protein
MRYLTFILLLGCTVQTVEIDDRLKPYIEIYKEEVNARNSVDLSPNLFRVVVQDLPDSINGMARPGEIIINSKIINDPFKVEPTFMHEVGHALYGLHHSDCGDVALMCLPAAWLYHDFKPILLDQLINSHDQGTNQ